MEWYESDILKDLDNARKELYTGYKMLGRLEDQSLRGAQELDEKEISKLIKENKDSIKKAREFLSYYTDQIVSIEFSNPDIKTPSHKIFDNELQQTINIYKEAEKLCNKNISELTEKRDEYVNNTKSLIEFSEEKLKTKLDHKVAEKRAEYARQYSSRIKNFRDDAKYFSNKINKYQDACDVLNMKAKCDNNKLKPLYNYVYEMQCYREVIPKKIDDIIKLENAKLNGVPEVDGWEINRVIDDKKSEFAEICTRMAREAQELTFHGMNDPFAKSGEYNLFKGEVQKACDVYEAVQSRFVKRIQIYDKMSHGIVNSMLKNNSITMKINELNRLKVDNKEIIDNCQKMRNVLMSEMEAAENARAHRNNTNRSNRAYAPGR